MADDCTYQDARLESISANIDQLRETVRDTASAQKQLHDFIDRELKDVQDRLHAKKMHVALMDQKLSEHLKWHDEQWHPHRQVAWATWAIVALSLVSAFEVYVFLHAWAAK